MSELPSVYGRGLYFEEFVEGLPVQTRGRTITEADLINFAGFSGDFNPMHTDAVYGANTQFGARIAHGALVFSVATGLAYQLGILEGTVIAFLGFEMKLKAPVYIGDTIRVVAGVKNRRAMESAGGGIVNLDVSIRNQKDEVVQEGKWTLMVKSRPLAAEGAESAPFAQGAEDA
jgi:acyl dehydratase